ncbi:MAG: ABC-F family ATP-binding cassette domain-containing protein [Alphaproteobacteria bacterium]
MALPPVLSLRGATVSFGGDPLFKDVDLHLTRGERACLVGRNGSGKSTLMKAIMGLVEMDRGELYCEPGARVDYLPQDAALPPGQTVHSFVSARRVDGSDIPEYLVDQFLTRLDLDPARDISTLSGGEGRRAALARVFADPPDVLLLDEPTNHLDLKTIEWVEETLLAFKGAILVVSHDRAFLNNVTTQSLWLDRGRMRSYDKGFAHYEQGVEAVLEEEERQAAKLDAHLVLETRWLLRGVSARRRRNQGRLEKLYAMRAARADLLGHMAGRTKADIRVGEVRSKMMIEAKKIVKKFETAGGERWILRDFNTQILRGDRIGVIGPNGAGKTTLLKILIGELAPDEGSVSLNRNAVTAYFDQKRGGLDPKALLRDILCPAGGDMLSVLGKPKHVRAYLKEFLFDPRQADAPVGSLSGGERNRLMLAKILATPNDLLILDEPTNDLDMDTLDLLQELLGDFDGTMLLVSHDRDFLDRTVTSTIVLEGDGTAIEYPGGYADYARQRGAAGKVARKAETPKPAAASELPVPPRPKDRLSYIEQRALQRLPGDMEKLETEIAALEKLLADQTLYARDRGRFEAATARHAAARTELAAAEERWLELEAKRETLESARENVRT